MELRKYNKIICLLAQPREEAQTTDIVEVNGLSVGGDNPTEQEQATNRRTTHKKNTKSFCE